MPQQSATQERDVPVRILTRAGWFQATVRVPGQSGLADYLDRAGDLVRLRHVQLEEVSHPIRTFSVRRKDMMLVIPPGDSSTAELDGRVIATSEPQVIAGIMELAMFSGTAHVPQDMSVEDFCHAARGFVTVHDCQLHLGAVHATKTDERHDAVLVDSPSIIAVSSSA